MPFTPDEPDIKTLTKRASRELSHGTCRPTLPKTTSSASLLVNSQICLLTTSGNVNRLLPLVAVPREVAQAQTELLHD